MPKHQLFVEPLAFGELILEVDLVKPCLQIPELFVGLLCLLEVAPFHHVLDVHPMSKQNQVDFLHLLQLYLGSEL